VTLHTGLHFGVLIAIGIERASACHLLWRGGETARLRRNRLAGEIGGNLSALRLAQGCCIRCHRGAAAFAFGEIGELFFDLTRIKPGQPRDADIRLPGPVFHMARRTGGAARNEALRGNDATSGHVTLAG